jgi:hypothetical protein
MSETLSEVYQAYPNDFYPPLQVWGCTNCFNSWVGRLPVIPHPADPFRLGRCPWCWNDDAEKIFLVE